MANDSHYPGGVSKPSPTGFKEKISGPVTKHHQLATGKTDGVTNVQGVGEVSKRPLVANDPKNY